MSPGCALRLFAGALPDFVAEIRHLIGDVGSSFLTAGRCDEQTDAYADANPNQQNTNLAVYMGIFFATKRVGGTTDAVGRGVVRIPDPIPDVIDIVRQTVTKGINQVNLVFPLRRCGNGVKGWQGNCQEDISPKMPRSRSDAEAFKGSDVETIASLCVIH